MAQANVVSITSAVEAERVLGPVESKAEGAYRMADILVDLVENMFGDRKVHKGIFGRGNCFYIDEDSVESLIFAAYELKDRIRDTRDALVEMIPA